MPLFALDFWGLGLPTPVGLAAVAVFGYLMGRGKRRDVQTQELHARRELKRAQAVARQLESIAEVIRRDLATHHGSVARFKERVLKLGGQEHSVAWKDLCNEAEEMLKPTLRLTQQLANAYDELRQQSSHLMTFTELRTDPLTGVSNRRALEDTMDTSFAMMNRYGLPFALIIFDIDHFKQLNDRQGHLYGDKMLRDVARLMADTVRDTDIVTRYGGEEFVIIMPQSGLDGACVFAERLREVIATTLKLTVSGGVSAALDGDTAQTILARADAALYSAKAAGRNLVYHHDGMTIEPTSEVYAGAAAEASDATTASGTVNA